MLARNLQRRIDSPRNTTLTVLGLNPNDHSGIAVGDDCLAVASAPKCPVCATSFRKSSPSLAGRTAPFIYAENIDSAAVESPFARV
jgi:hypothetical protein